MAQAVAFLLPKKVSRIILARPAVEAGEKLGFLPGDLQEKVNPYLRPLYDALYDMLEIDRVERLLERGTVEIAPLAFMRGRTLNDAFVILDEAQNTTSEQMKMFLTRLGFGSKAVVTGDVTQIDLPSGQGPGLVEAMKIVSQVDGIAFVHFDDRDVVRHKLVQQIVKAYEACSRATSHRPVLRRSCHPRPRRVPLPVSVVDDDGRPLRAPALAAWLSRVAPARARGAVTVAVVSDARVRALNRQYRGMDRATDVLSFPPDERRDVQSVDAGTPSAQCAARDTFPRRHRDRPRRGAASGARGRARRAHRVARAGAARSAAPARLRSRAGRRDDGARRSAAAAQGRPAGRPDRAEARR